VVEYFLYLYMDIKKFLTLFFMVWVCVSVALAFPAMTLAEPYQPGETLRITTVPSPVELTSKGDPLEWSVAPQKSGQGNTILTFIMTDSDQVICRLTVSGSDAKRVAHLTWDDSARPPKIIQQGELLIAPGSPVPCDMLPLGFLTGQYASKTYEVKRIAGGQTFMDGFQVDGVETDIAEARSNGWLTGQNQPKRLVMITAVNARTGQLAVRQLWVPGDDWWVFEETPYRQSWRMRE
jgi:hypothetical protein